jgi:hypothetical protein
MRVDDKEDTKNVSIMILIVQLRSLFYLLLFNDFRAFFCAPLVIALSQIFVSFLTFYFQMLCISIAIELSDVCSAFSLFCVMFCAVVCCLEGVIFAREGIF